MSSLYKKLTVCCLMLCMLTGCAGSRQAMSGQADVVDETTERTDTEQVDTGREKEPDIVCWGDSLTYGTGGEGVTYPSVLADETGLTVYNYGVCGEKADQIAVRMGLYPMTTGAFTIPAEREPVALSLLCDGEDPIMLRLGDAGMNPCDIAGVKANFPIQKKMEIIISPDRQRAMRSRFRTVRLSPWMLRERSIPMTLWCFLSEAMTGRRRRMQRR